MEIPASLVTPREGEFSLPFFLIRVVNGCFPPVFVVGFLRLHHFPLLPLYIFFIKAILALRRLCAPVEEAPRPPSNSLLIVPHDGLRAQSDSLETSLIPSIFLLESPPPESADCGLTVSAPWEFIDNSDIPLFYSPELFWVLLMSR